MASRRPHLPLEQRIRLHDEVIRLRKERLSYRRIIESLYERYGVRISESLISLWVRGKKQPLGRVNKFDGNPSPELAGVIGVVLSDGTRQLHGGDKYEIGLRVNDGEYAAAFGRDLAKVLGKKSPYKPHWSRSEQRWIARGCSILLFKCLERPWQELKPYIENDEACVARFLRRFFDGEACIDGRKLTVHNTKRDLLLYIQQLLRRYFGIVTTGPRMAKKSGTLLRDPRNGKIYRRKKDCYYLHIQADSLPLFQRYIGFAIKRKDRRLMKAIQK